MSNTAEDFIMSNTVPMLDGRFAYSRIVLIYKNCPLTIQQLLTVLENKHNLSYWIISSAIVNRKPRLYALIHMNKKVRVRTPKYYEVVDGDKIYHAQLRKVNGMIWPIVEFMRTQGTFLEKPGNEWNKLSLYDNTLIIDEHSSQKKLKIARKRKAEAKELVCFFLSLFISFFLFFFF